ESVAVARNGFERVEPLRLAYASARAKARLRHRLRRRALHLDSELVSALGLSPEVAERAAVRAAELEACDQLERRLSRRPKTDEIGRLMRFEGLGNLDAALANGKGAVLYSLHLWGKYTFLAALAGSGYPATAIALRPKPDRMQWMTAQADRFGYSHIWMDAGGFRTGVEAANVLRRNGIVMMMIDWPTARMGEVDFLNRRARLSSGVVTVAESMGAPMLDY